MGGKKSNSDEAIAILGLGYVGLPLALEFAKYKKVIGFDTSEDRVEFVLDQIPSEISSRLTVTTDESCLEDASIFIVTVPTPVDENKQPSINDLKSACRLIAKHISVGDLVVFESTVYPGLTEEVCVPILEQISNLAINSEFYVGYSPERMDPGESGRGVANIVKLVSGSNQVALDLVDELYSLIVAEGTYRTSSIRVAEAAKVIENIQRDINIALVNELVVTFDHMELSTYEVLEAAATKWNFLSFKPGLVGGHCIGVDPYYLTYKSRKTGYEPEVILAGRRINDSMPAYFADKFLKLISQNSDKTESDLVACVFGATFKENCDDIRNSKIVELIYRLRDYGVSIDIVDPKANAQEFLLEYNMEVNIKPPKTEYDGILIGVAHSDFISLGASYFKSFTSSPSKVFDLKCVFGVNSDFSIL